MRVLRNSFWVKYNHTNSEQFTPFLCLSFGQGLYQARVQIMQISRNSFWLQLNHVNSVQFALNFVLSLYSAES